MRTQASRYRFFREWSGTVVGQSALGAYRLAKAEQVAEEIGLTFEWRADYDDYEDMLGDHALWCADERRGIAHSHEVSCCLARDESGQVVASLCGIIDASREYIRVVEAELSLEASDIALKVRS